MIPSRRLGHIGHFNGFSIFLALLATTFDLVCELSSTLVFN